MRLSRGWRGLLLFWVGIGSFCVIGAGALQVLGPASPSHALARQAPEPSVNEFPDHVPMTLVAAATVPAPVVEASDNSADPSTVRDPEPAPAVGPAPVVEASDNSANPSTMRDPEPAPAVAAETTASADPPVSLADAQSAVPRQHDIVQPPPAPPAEVLRRPPPPRERALHMRIVRDSDRCPKTVCYKWHLIEQRLKLPHSPTLDMAELRLAPSLREAAEKGEVELIIDAVERHKTIKGRDSVVIVARNLAGVLPGPRSFAALAASGP